MLLLAACKADDEYSEWPCRFSYDNSLHLDATLASAMDVNSPGVFCTITEHNGSGGKYLMFSSNHRMQTTQPETEEEKRAEYVLGLNNGIIIGFQNAVFDDFYRSIFVAYDVQCPNCVRTSGNAVTPNFRITAGDNGIATCSKCQRRYDLNNGGLIINGQEGDTSLEKYAASTTGPHGHVGVFRHR